MGHIVLVCRLVRRDLRRRPAQAVLLLLAITAATTTLTLGFALHGVTSQPYQQTRTATAGPDVTASFLNLPPMPPGESMAAGLAGLQALARAPGVTAHTGPYPVAWATLRAHGLTAGGMAEGRGTAPAPIDQPKLTQGSWVRAGGVVVERSFADALGIHAGDRIALNGRPFQVAGIAVTAASVPFPDTGFTMNGGPFPTPDTGLIWLTQTAARSLATRSLPLSYVLNLKLADQATAGAFASAYDSNPRNASYLVPWQGIRDADARMVATAQEVLLAGSWLLGLLAVASVAVLVGGRMADQTRRVGLLKAVGGTPRLVATVLLAENLLLALVAAAAGLAAGRLAAPLLTSPGAGLTGTPGAPSLTLPIIALVAAVALAVAVAATLVPAIRAARTSTVAALADSARPPQRKAALIAISARLPVPLLLGLRLAARRPRRMVLSAASIAITVTGIVAVLAIHAHSTGHVSGLSALDNPLHDRVNQVLLVITVALVALAAINAIFITWATALDARYSSALTRALGATPQQVTAGLSAAQLLPALAGAILGIPLGLGLLASVSHGTTLAIPSAAWLLTVVPGTLAVIAGLTAAPARIGARRPVAEILQSELA
jgi:putative ABC transport system permease protein